MKQVICALALSLVATTGLMAQKANVKAAEKLATSGKDFGEARNLSKATLSDAETQNDPYAWYVAGLVEHEYFSSENVKRAVPGQTVDEVAMYKALVDEVPYWIKALELDKQPDEKGKVKLKYTKKITDYLRKDMMEMLQGGNVFINNKDYASAVKAFQTYLDLRKHEVFAGDPQFATMDTTTMDVIYYTALLSHELKDYDNAIRIANENKAQEYKKEDLYQILAASHVAKGDSTSFVAVLKEGADLFPESMYFVGNLIQTKANQGKIDEAIEEVKKVVEKKPDNDTFLRFLGGLYEQKEDWVNSAAAYKRAIAIKPDDFDANYNMARSLYNQAVTLLAVDKIDKLTEDKAKALFRESLPYFETAYQAQPAQVYYLYANVCERLGDTAKQQELLKANQ